jgi:hypothetical protein
MIEIHTAVVKEALTVFYINTWQSNSQTFTHVMHISKRCSQSCRF